MGKYQEFANGILDVVRNHPGISATSTIVYEKMDDVNIPHFPNRKAQTNAYWESVQLLQDENMVVQEKGRLYPADQMDQLEEEI